MPPSPSPLQRTPALAPKISRGLRHVVRSILRGAEHSQANRRQARELVWQWVGAKWPRLLPSALQMEQPHFEFALPGQST